MSESGEIYSDRQRGRDREKVKVGKKTFRFGRGVRDGARCR